MAGPCASVFVACEVDVVETVRDRLISQVSECQRGNDFWVCDTTVMGGRYKGEGRPFFWQLSARDEWNDEPNQYEQSHIATLLSAPPCAQVSFCAMCNDDWDHRVLGELCLSLTRELNGIVCFDGLLQPYQTIEEMRSWRQLSAKEYCENFVGEIGTGSGTLAAFGLDPENSPSYHVGDARFLEHWLAHPRFRMVK